MITLTAQQLTSICRVNRQFAVNNMVFDSHPELDGAVIVTAVFRTSEKRFVLDERGGLVTNADNTANA